VFHVHAFQIVGAALGPDSVTLGNIDRVLREPVKSSTTIDSTGGDGSVERSDAYTDRMEQSLVPLSVAVVLGNEGNGLRTNILRRCDALVKIAPNSDYNDCDIDALSTPSSEDDSTVDSLNVGVAGGILLHHFLGK
jgi:tRNA G18 (ribose-2'-O)-methylase SpoU